MQKLFENRVFRCGQSDYNKDEILSANDTHTDERLRAIAKAGFNGVWLRIKLRDVVPTALFCNYIKNADERLRSVSKLCRRAASFGLGVWAYFTEPLGLDVSHRFWRDHPELVGQRSDFLGQQRIALCSSTEPVRSYLRQGFTELFSEASLAGAILITTSEHVSHCWAHVLSSPATFPNPESFWHKRCSCPRCGQCTPVDVITEIVTTVNNCVKSANPDANVVAWDWSWHMHVKPPYKAMVERLPKDVILMGDFERGGTVQRCGRQFVVDEYSLMYPGPSSRFRGEAKLTQNKRQLWAKLQINTSHELASTPNLPLVVSLYRKFRFLRQAKAAGFMACWNIGCEPDTLNTFAVNALSGPRFDNNEERWLKKLAVSYFGTDIDSEAVVKAWYRFTRACNHYPIGGDYAFLYTSLVNYAIAYPLKLRFTGKEMGPSWIKHEFGDRLEDTAVSYSLTELTELLGTTASAWSKGVDLYRSALTGAEHNERQKRELGVAAVAGATFRSAHNIYHWYVLRHKKRSTKLTAAELDIVKDEINNLQAILPVVQADPRTGFHQEAQWQMFSPSIIKRKLRDLKGLIPARTK